MDQQNRRRTGGISVETAHIFPIIKKWLYSEKDIFLRELVSNAADAVTKHKRLISLGEIEGSDEDSYRITVTVDKTAGTLTVSDNGIGMTEEEISRHFFIPHPRIFTKTRIFIKWRLRAFFRRH